MTMLPAFFDSALQLIVRTSTDLPPDVRAAMKTSLEAEPSGTRASQALTIIAQNIDLACTNEGAICQDTGMPTFEVKTPVGANQIWMRNQIRAAVAEATRRGKLRPNSVDSITGENSGDNLGPGTPIIHFAQWERDEIELKLILKGGGCENTNAQYALPVELPHLGRADRTLEGARKCILHAVWHAQGKGCSPGAVGVCIGGDRTSGYAHAKEQLFRTLDDVNPDGRLAELEASIMATVNNLEVGPMGFGGEVTLIGCKIGALNRLPASFFVSVAYDCWAFRRLGVVLDGTSGAISRWLYRDPSHPIIPMINQAGFARTGREVALRAPLTVDQVRALKVGDVVLISGPMFTGRDAVHSHLTKHEPPVDLRGAVLYHCGPVVVKEGSGWRVTAAGPTTSIREEPYQGEIIGRYGIRAVIGKGGMGAKTLAALNEHGAVYLNAIGGAAQFYGRTITSVDGVSLLEFGTPEAMWHLTVRDFPAIVTMDAHGNSLHKDIEQQSGQRLEAIGI
jgi:fumarate hydratase class I